MPHFRAFKKLLQRAYIEPLRENPKAWLKQTFPISKWLPLYKASYIPYDIIAGFTVGITLLPISMAYAQMALLRPEFGLYSSFVGMIFYLFMGTSKDAIIGPSAITCMMLSQFNQLNPLYHQGDNTYANILCLTTGLIMLFIGFFKFGFIVNLFSIPVVSGFTSAAALSIMASQLRTLVGIRSAPVDYASAEFIKQLKHLADRSNEARQMDIIFGCCSLAFLLVVEYSHIYFELFVARCFKPPQTERGKQFRHYFLICVRLIVASRHIAVFVTTTALAFHFYNEGSDDIYDRLTLVGDLKPGLPSFTLPRWAVVNVTKEWIPPADNSTNSNGTWLQTEVVLKSSQQVMESIAVGVIVIPLMSIMEHFAITKALGRKNGYRIDASQELVSVGLANIFQSFIQAFPVTAATAKTVINDRCGVKSLLSTTFSIVIVFVSLEHLTNVFYYVPKAALSAIIISATHRLFDYNAPKAIWVEYKPDFLLWIFTFLLCLLYDLAYGIVIAILINMVVFLRPFVGMKLSVIREPLEIISTGLPVGDHHLGRVTIVQLSHDLKYPSVDKFLGRMSKLLASTDVNFIVDCRFVTGFDFTGVQAWRMLLRMVYQKKKNIIFTNLNESVLPQMKQIGLENFQLAKDIDAAIATYSSRNVYESRGLPTLPELQEANGSSGLMINKLRQTFSILFNDPGINSRRSTMANGQPPSGILKRASSMSSNGPSRTVSFRMPLEVVEVEKMGTSAASDTNQGADVPEWMLETREQQEARLVKLLMDQTTPNFYGDLPIAIGLGDYQDFDGFDGVYDQNESSNRRTNST